MLVDRDLVTRAIQQIVQVGQPQADLWKELANHIDELSNQELRELLTALSNAQICRAERHRWAVPVTVPVGA